MKKSFIPLICIFFLLGLSACKNKEEITKPVNIVRLDSLIAVYPELDSAKRVQLIDDYRDILSNYGWIITGEANLNPDDIMLVEWANSPITTMFGPKVNEIYTDLAPEQKSIATIIELSSENDITLPAHTYATAIWNVSNNILVVDSVAYIGLNHYLGSGSDAYLGWADYKRALKNREMIPVDLAENLVAISYPYSPNGDANVLSRLLYEGALATAKSTLVPDASPASILGFTEDSFHDVQQHESFIWDRLVQGGLLYSTDAAVMSNLFDARPASTILSADAPGRAARLVGYNIVQAYCKKNPEATLSFLLTPDFYSNGTEVIKSASYPD